MHCATHYPVRGTSAIRQTTPANQQVRPCMYCATRLPARGRVPNRPTDPCYSQVRLRDALCSARSRAIRPIDPCYQQVRFP